MADERKADRKEGRILIVDDESDLRELLQELLTEITPHVFTAGDGEDALTKYQQIRPHAILSDLKMPRKTGMELLADIRAQYSQVPFVIVTGYDDKESLLGAIRLGASDFIEKPFKPGQLLGVMERALDLGLAMSQLEGGLELLYNQSKLPSDKIDHIRKVRAAILAMKYENSNFRKKAV